MSGIFKFESLVSHFCKYYLVTFKIFWLYGVFPVQGIHGGDLLSIPNVVTTSAGMCDIDIRPVMDTHIHEFYSIG